MAYSTLCGLEVIRFLAHAGRGATSREVSAGTGITRATTYRTLDELERAGWVVAEGTPRRFSASWRVAGLGLQMLAHNDVREAALRNVIDLASETGAHAFLSFQDNAETVFTDSVEVVAGRPMLAVLYSRLPAVLTASGRTTLAHLPGDELDRLLQRGVPRMDGVAPTSADEVRAEVARAQARGYGISDRVLVGDLVSIAASVLDVSQRPVASIGISPRGATQRGDVEARFGETVVQWARRASIELGYRAVRPIG